MKDLASTQIPYGVRQRASYFDLTISKEQPPKAEGMVPLNLGTFDDFEQATLHSFLESPLESFLTALTMAPVAKK